MSDGAAMPADLAREIARQGEVRLNAVLSLATAADARATTLCAIFGAASVGLAAAVLAYLGADHHVTSLIISGAWVSLLLFAASVVFAYASAPGDFYVAGGNPSMLRSWSWDGAKWRTESEMLEATAQRLEELIQKDAGMLETESRRVTFALWIGLASVPSGMLLYFVSPYLTRFF